MIAQSDQRQPFPIHGLPPSYMPSQAAPKVYDYHIAEDNQLLHKVAQYPNSVSQPDVKMSQPQPQQYYNFPKYNGPFVIPLGDLFGKEKDKY